MIKKYIHSQWIFYLLFLALSLPLKAQASVWKRIQEGLGVIGEEAYDVPQGSDPYSPATVAVNIINIVLGVLSIFVIIVIIYAGHLWMTAGGNEEQVTKAKNLLKNGFIGLAIIITSFAITVFVLYYLTRAAGGQLYFPTYYGISV